MSRCLLACSVVAVSVAGAAGTVQAEEIFIENYSFEALELPESTWVAGAPEGWTLLEGHFGVLNPSDAAFPGGIPDGYNVAYSNGGTISQVLSAVLEANTVYSLAVTLGNRPTLPFPGYQVQLLAGGVVIAEDASSITPDPATFAGTSVSFQSEAINPLVGLPLEVRLTSAGRQVLFDMVTLNSMPIPAPGALALLAVAGLAGRRRRR